MGPTSTTILSQDVLHPLTYNDVFLFWLECQEGIEVDLTQQQKNHRSALVKFAFSHGKTFADQVGSELATDFPKAISHYLDTSKLSATSIPSQRSYLNSMQKCYRDLLVKLSAPKSFTEALSYYIERSGLSRNKLETLAFADRHGVLHEWINQKRIPRNLSKITAVEKVLGLHLGTLTSMLPVQKKITRQTQTTAHGRRSAVNSENEYRLKSLPDKLAKQWKALVKFKTALVPPIGKVRDVSGVWRASEDGEYQSMHLDRITAFFGFLTLPPKPSDPSHSGKGLPLEDLSLAHYLDTELVEDYLEFIRARAGGNYNGMTIQYISFINSLLHPKNGFVIQYPELFPDVVDLKTKVVLAHERYKNVRKHLEPHVVKTRDPNETNKQIIESDRPLDFLIQTGDKVYEYAKIRWENREVNELAAIDYRNALLIRMLISNPLRQKNYRRMTCSSDNFGHLHKAEDGSWWVEIPRKEFKNLQGAAGDRDYKVMVNKELWPEIEFYLAKCRPVLLGTSKSDCLFLTMQGKPLDKNRFNDIVKTLTRSFCPLKNSGFGPHAFRHIIATDYIKNHPNGFQVVADILHDKLQTVLDNYAHLAVYDGFRHWDNYLNDRKAAVHAEIADAA